MSVLEGIVALLLAAGAAGLVLFGLFRWKLGQGVKAWKQVGATLGLGFEEGGSRIGVLRGTFEGLPVVAEVVNTEEGFEDGLQTYTRIRVPLEGADASRAGEQLAAASHGFVGSVDDEGVLWMRVGIVFDPRTLAQAIRHAHAAARAAAPGAGRPQRRR